MNKKLEAQIERRKQEAKDKDIEGKASTIAMYLGQGGPRHEQGAETTEYLFDNGVFRIKTHMVTTSDGGFGCSTSVFYQGNVVYEEGGLRVSTFVPGEWELRFNGLYGRAVQAGNQARLEETARKEAEDKAGEAKERKNWGL